MKKVSIFCILLTAICSLAFADVDGINKATAAAPAPAVDLTKLNVVPVAPANAVKMEIEDLMMQIASNKAAGMEVPAVWTARLSELELQLGKAPAAGGNRGSLDQGGENCAGATVIGALPYADSGTKGATDDCAGRPWNDVFYVYTVATTGTHNWDMCGSDDDSYIRVWTDDMSCCVGAFLTNDDECGGLDPRGSGTFTAGQTVYFECGNYTESAAPNNYFFNLTGPSATVLPGENCTNAIAYSLGSCVDGTTVGYNNDLDFACPYTGSTSADVVYTFTAAANEEWTFSLCQGTTNYDTKLYIYAANCGVNPPQCCNDDACSSPLFSSYVSRIECCALVAGVTYYVVVDGYGGANGNYTLCSSICQACDVVCPETARLEGEPCPNIPDLFNTGCNDAVAPSFSPIGCNDQVCGTSESGTGDPGLRDTDWYLLTVAQRESLSVSVTADFISGLVLVQLPCPGTQLDFVSAGACEYATINRCLEPGDYAIVVVVNAAPPVVCGQYVLTTSCQPCAEEVFCEFPNRDLEPNDFCDTAQPVFCGDYLCGNVNPSGDDDYYMITIPTGVCGILHIDVFANATPGYYPFGLGLDSYVYLWGSDCATVIGADDDGGIGFDSHLDSPCLPAGTYYIDVRGFADGSVGPYVLSVSCEQCQCPCVWTDLAQFYANEGAGYPAYICADLCVEQSTLISICSDNGLPFDPANAPIVTVSPGCQFGPTRCDRACDPGAADYMGILPYSLWTLNAANGCWEFTLHGVQNGCVCICLEGFLSAEMGTVGALAGDGTVRLDWTTLSETGVDLFQISRAVKGHEAMLIGSVEAMGSGSNGYTYHFTDNNVVNGTTYVYSLVVVDVDGSRHDVATTVEATPALNAAVISEYALHQNFPNPFNPSTSITFDLVSSGMVSLKVYNTLGQEVAAIVNGTMEAGRHVVTFDAANLPSGMYLYQIEANGFKAQHKMLLMK